MFEPRTAVFLMNLVQDVNVLRPIIAMASRDFGFRVLILVSSKFAVRDLFGIWRAELETLSVEAGATIEVFADDWEASRQLQGGGVIFAGSESSLPEHRTTHNIFRYAPPDFLKVTLQHGFECVGFRQSSAHDWAHGKSVSFGADIVCAWQEAEFLTALAPSQRAKLHVTGPTTVLQMFTEPVDRKPGAAGLVCENLHSVRFRTNTKHKHEFVGVFGEYCRLLAEEGSEVVLRPHPGGQYVLKNKVALPPNARIENAPMYRVDLRRFSYGISAPSSVLVDMLLADVPTAVWRDEAGDVDAGNYVGLSDVSTPREWRDFAREAAAAPQPFIDRQRRFLAEQRMPIAPREVFARFAELFNAARRVPLLSGGRRVSRQRFLFVANAHLPTLQVCLERPLIALVNSGELVTELLTEPELRREELRLGSAEALGASIDARLDQFNPDAIIFSRYSGPFGPDIVAWARRNRIPLIYQIDDDLLGVPASLGERKFAYHNDPERLGAVRSLMSAADVVYASTERLRERLLGYDLGLAVVTGPINCSGRVIRMPKSGRAKVIGYMASADHTPNLAMIVPAVVALLDRHPTLSFELFGSIPIPPELEKFCDRVRRIEPIADYVSFLEGFAEREWDIGLCPLTPTDFNLTKSNNKWIEYTSLGIAVIASANMIYDDCGADGCAVLATDLDDWLSGLELLVSDDAEREAMVTRAQAKLEAVYGIGQHRTQILEVVALARARAAQRDRVPQQRVEEDE